MIELTPTKLPHYILPALPALWLLVVMCFTMPESASKWRQYLGYGLSAIAALSGLGLALFLGYGALRFGGTGAGEAFFLSLFVILLTAALLWVLALDAQSSIRPDGAYPVIRRVYSYGYHRRGDRIV